MEFPPGPNERKGSSRGLPLEQPQTFNRKYRFLIAVDRMEVRDAVIAKYM